MPNDVAHLGDMYRRRLENSSGIKNRPIDFLWSPSFKKKEKKNRPTDVSLEQCAGM